MPVALRLAVHLALAIQKGRCDTATVSEWRLRGTLVFQLLPLRACCLPGLSYGFSSKTDP